MTGCLCHLQFNRMISNTWYSYAKQNMNKLFTVWRNALEYNEPEVTELKKYWSLLIALSQLSLTELLKSTTLLPAFTTIWSSFHTLSDVIRFLHTSLTKPSRGILTSLLIKKAAKLMMRTKHAILSFLLSAGTLE